MTKTILKLDQELTNLDQSDDEMMEDELIEVDDDTNDGVLTQRN